MKVLKFGGTSVGSPQRMKDVAAILNETAGRKIVVLSAVSGTTNKLVQIGETLYAGKHGEARKLIAAMEQEYVEFVQELYSTDEYRKQGEELIRAHFQYIGNFTKDLFTLYEERAILAQGELLSTALFHFYLTEQGVTNRLLASLDFMRIDKDGEPDDWYIEHHLELELKASKDIDLFICQGYICRNAYGEVDNLKRGGSDYTASLIGAAIRADAIEIWTDIDGLHNNDPRVVDHTFPVRELSYDEAAELAYFGAKILHPSSVRPARERDIPVWLKNTMDSSAYGTHIFRDAKAAGIKAVAAKDGITAIKIKSGRMLMAYGFLRHVFEVFERFKTPIDMITTSEVAVSVTIDRDEYLDEIKTALENFGSVEIDRDQVIVCVVGDFLAENAGYGARIMNALNEVPVRMISYGGSKNNISVLVAKADKEKALLALNAGIFEQAEA